jgi:hypothetical protein
LDAWRIQGYRGKGRPNGWCLHPARTIARYTALHSAALVQVTLPQLGPRASVGRFFSLGITSDADGRSQSKKKPLIRTLFRLP